MSGQKQHANLVHHLRIREGIPVHGVFGFDQRPQNVPGKILFASFTGLVTALDELREHGANAFGGALRGPARQESREMIDAQDHGPLGLALELHERVENLLRIGLLDFLR